jgi:hypothetical protein
MIILLSIYSASAQLIPAVFTPIYATAAGAPPKIFLPLLENMLTMADQLNEDMCTVATKCFHVFHYGIWAAADEL